MIAAGFLDQRASRKASLGLVLLLHAGVISAVVLIKGNGWVRDVDTVTVARFDAEPVPPPPPPPPPTPREVEIPAVSRIVVPDPIVPPPLAPFAGTTERLPTPPPLGPVGPAQNPSGPVGPQLADATPVRPTPPPPVRIDSQFAPGAQLQPPYPDEEVRREREGEVRVRVTIGADGRVVAAEQVSATSAAFWRETERWARARWRFRPATVDGRPVQSSKVLTIRFRLGA